MRPYFAYGSNLWLPQMAERCPDATVLGPATVSGWRFVITARGWASLIPDAASRVHGLVWSLTPADEAALDRHEGVAESDYRKEEWPLPEHGRTLVYLATETGLGTPPDWYLARIVGGAALAEFPADYIDTLKKWSGGPF